MTAPSMAEAPALLGPSGGGGAGLLPQKVLRILWGPVVAAAGQERG